MKKDMIIGPATNAQVVIVRSLFGEGKREFKLPVAFDYDIALTKVLFNKVIYSLEEIGLHVLCSTCDMGSRNQALAKELSEY